MKLKVDQNEGALFKNKGGGTVLNKKGGGGGGVGWGGGGGVGGGGGGGGGVVGGGGVGGKLSQTSSTPGKRGAGRRRIRYNYLLSAAEGSLKGVGINPLLGGERGERETFAFRRE